MMKLLFVDPRLGYDAYTSTRKPLGGSQSAVTYLALALAEGGVATQVANLRSDDAIQEGIAWLSLSKLQARFAHYLNEEGITHLIVVNSPALAALRPKVAWSGYWILWNHHWIDQPALAPLGDPALQNRWDAIVSLSEFHHRGMAGRFGLAQGKHWILRNAASPHVATLYRNWDEFRDERMARRSARWIYTSTPFRGLDVLVAAWRRLNPPPDWSCTALTGMSLYHSDDPNFDELLDVVAATPGMRRLEPVGQGALAPLLAEHDFWAYPCTWLETSCISAVEAVGAGLYPVTTDLGALGETLEGWGTFVIGEREGLIERWSDAARAEASRRDADREAWLRVAWDHRMRIVSQWTWARRAREWNNCLQKLGA